MVLLTYNFAFALASDLPLLHIQHFVIKQVYPSSILKPLLLKSFLIRAGDTSGISSKGTWLYRLMVVVKTFRFRINDVLINFIRFMANKKTSMGEHLKYFI